MLMKLCIMPIYRTTNSIFEKWEKCGLWPSVLQLLQLSDFCLYFIMSRDLDILFLGLKDVLSVTHAAGNISTKCKVPKTCSSWVKSSDRRKRNKDGQSAQHNAAPLGALHKATDNSKTMQDIITFINVITAATKCCDILISTTTVKPHRLRTQWYVSLKLVMGFRRIMIHKIFQLVPGSQQQCRQLRLKCECMWCMIKVAIWR